MRWFYTLSLCLALLAGAAGAHAAEAPLVAAQVKPAQVVAAPGGSFKLNLVLTIAPKFHINGPSAGEAGLIPTRVEIKAPAGLEFAPPIYPKARQVRVQFADKPVEMYSGKVVIGLEGQASPRLRPGAYAVKALVSYQACDDLVCHMPAGQELSFTVKVAPKP